MCTSFPRAQFNSPRRRFISAASSPPPAVQRLRMLPDPRDHGSPGICPIFFLLPTIPNTFNRAPRSLGIELSLLAHPWRPIQVEILDHRLSAARFPFSDYQLARRLFPAGSLWARGQQPRPRMPNNAAGPILAPSSSHAQPRFPRFHM